jgi:hypothetical protein
MNDYYKYNKQSTQEELHVENGFDWKRLFETVLIVGISILAVYALFQLIRYLIATDNTEKKKRPRIFISHSWRFDNDFYKLLDRFQNYEFDYFNHSIFKDEPLDVSSNKELLEGIEKKIKGCSKVVILAGMYVNKSTVIREELRIAKKLNKEIIAIIPHGQKKVPLIVRAFSKTIIGTNTPNIINHLLN